MYIIRLFTLVDSFLHVDVVMLAVNSSRNQMSHAFVPFVNSFDVRAQIEHIKIVGED
jgi:hypothetical protein